MTERPSDLLILALQPGDTLIVHLPKPPDAAYVEDVKAAIRRQLSFDVPIIVAGPGVTFEVARPVSGDRLEAIRAKAEEWRNYRGHGNYPEAHAYAQAIENCGDALIDMLDEPPNEAQR